MARILVAKTLKGMQPVDETGEEALRRFGLGETFSCEVKKPRNIQFHRKFFAMLNIIYKQQDYYKSTDHLLAACKLSIGHFEVIRTKKDEYRLPMSISFAAMDDLQFANFYDRACKWVCEEVIPGLQRQGLEEAVAEELRQFGAPEG